MFQCARTGCCSPAKSNCSSCSMEHYCSRDCQSFDWKIHKSLCPILKKLLKTLQPFNEVEKVTRETLESKKGNNIRVLKHLLSYAEFQFGEEVIGKSYRERIDGKRIYNWEAETCIINNILTKLVSSYGQCSSLSDIDCDVAKFPYLEQSSIILNKWLNRLDSGARDYTFNQGQKNRLFEQLYFTEANMAGACIDGRRFDAAEGHCQRCLAYSRRYAVEGAQKISIILKSLRNYSILRERQGNYSESINYAEECYNLVVEVYDPVHLEAQQAAGLLIDILIKDGNLYDAERYAQITYSNLRDKKNGINQESEEVAMGAHNLADVILRQDGDFLKAEILAREALHIRTLVYGGGHHSVGVSCNLLARVLHSQLKYGDETVGLFKRSIAIDLKHEGPDGANTAAGNRDIGQFYQQMAVEQPTVELIQKYLQLAKSHVEEGLRINSKIYGSSHAMALESNTLLGNILRTIATVDQGEAIYHAAGH